VDNPGGAPLEAIRTQVHVVPAQLAALGQGTGGVLDGNGREARARDAHGLRSQLRDWLVAVPVPVAGCSAEWRAAAEALVKADPQQ